MTFRTKLIDPLILGSKGYPERGFVRLKVYPEIVHPVFILTFVDATEQVLFIWN